MESYRGHSYGFKQLENTLEWCMAIGIKVVSVYAFSIENFKRTQKEIDVLMDLAEEKFEEFLKQDAFINRNGICVRVIGDLSLLRPTTRKAAEKLMWHTRNGSNAILNIACPYTSREEMNTAINVVKLAVDSGKLEKGDVTEHLLDDCMYTQDSYPLDIMVRTSGEVRLSDYMLWQKDRDAYESLKPKNNRIESYLQELYASRLESCRQ
ncbi:hypothetical protein HDV06_002672 [Boothiomyces sp. JEL0866]|nr:hypothetical protein HDV06_002672 [Boothiomyces sp. JEL0866]